MITVVTDRAQSDVDALRALFRKALSGMTEAEATAFYAGGHKGGYDWTDYNRVGVAVNDLADRLNLIGFDITTTARDDWAITEPPNATARAALLADLTAIKAALGSVYTLPSVIPEMTFTQANAIELMLEQIDKKIVLLSAGSFFCGELYCGEG